MTWKKSIPMVGALIVVLFAVFIVWSLNNPSAARAEECYGDLPKTGDHMQHAVEFCECMGATPLTKVDEVGVDENFCRVGFRDYKSQEYFCEMNPDDLTHFNCAVISGSAPILGSFAPRHDTHIITGVIYSGGTPITTGMVTFYNPKNTKERIIDRTLVTGRYEIDLSLLPSGWRVGDVGTLEVHYLGKVTKKAIFIKSSSEQVENILII